MIRITPIMRRTAVRISPVIRTAPTAIRMTPTIQIAPMIQLMLITQIIPIPENSRERRRFLTIRQMPVKGLY